MRVVLTAEKPDLARFFLSDNAREITRAEPAVEGPDARTGLTEARVVRRDGQVADHMKNVSTADGVARHHGNDRLGEAADLLLHIKNIEPRDAIFAEVAAVPAHLLVPAGAEGLVAFPGKDNHADRGIFAAVIEGILHFLDGLGTERVADLGAVDRDLGDPVLRLFELQIRVILNLVPDRFCHGGRKAEDEVFRK